MVNKEFYIRFEAIVAKIFEANGYKVSPSNGRFGPVTSPDFIIEDRRERVGVEVKFYRASTPTGNDIRRSLAQLERALDSLGIEKGLLVLSVSIPAAMMDRALVSNRVDIRSINDLLRMAAAKGDLYDELTELLRVSKLETTVLPSAEPQISEFESFEITEEFKQAEIQKDEETSQRIRDLILRITTSKAGPKTAKVYETLCSEAIKELFEQDLGEIKDQHRIADGFHRVDFIASIKSESAFWLALRNDFRSRYVVFEVKNYPKAITQSEIYSTEKYLFTNALRSVAFVIARNGENKGALHARQGALREMGKLIVTITQDELLKMLHLKLANEETVSLLADKVDDFLTTLAR